VLHQSAEHNGVHGANWTHVCCFQVLKLFARADCQTARNPKVRKSPNVAPPRRRPGPHSERNSLRDIRALPRFGRRPDCITIHRSNASTSSRIFERSRPKGGDPTHRKSGHKILFTAADYGRFSESLACPAEPPSKSSPVPARQRSTSAARSAGSAYSKALELLTWPEMFDPGF
jgi:hypothetical protein